MSDFRHSTKNPDYVFKPHIPKSYMLIRCRVCGTLKKITEFLRCSSRIGDYLKRCKKCTARAVNEHIAKRRDVDHRFRLYISSRSSAKVRSLTNTLRMSDIPLPDRCAYLGIPLNYGTSRKDGKRARRWDAPSIDRIDSSKGYTPDNIQVISDLANKMKQDATIGQLIAFAEGVLRTHAPDRLK